MTRAGAAGAVASAPPTLESEAEYRGAFGRLNRDVEASTVLRLLMRALESYRAARKLGWSRPWNKYGVRTFQAFRLRPAEDRDLLRLGVEVVGRYGADMPAAAADFVQDLTEDGDRLMGFVFVQEIEDVGERWEAATLSLGRRARASHRHRDRLDVILESPVGPSVVPGPRRLRLFVDPFEGSGPPVWSAASAVAPGDCAVELFDRLADLSSLWAGDPGRVWSHWSTRYIDYFGPRRWTSEGSPFALAGAPGDGASERRSAGGA